MLPLSVRYCSGVCQRSQKQATAEIKYRAGLTQLPDCRDHNGRKVWKIHKKGLGPSHRLFQLHLSSVPIRRVVGSLWGLKNRIRIDQQAALMSLKGMHDNGEI